MGAILESGSDLEVSWDNTVRLSAIYQPGRTALNIADYCGSGAAAGVSAEPRSCGYGAGFPSARVDWLSELDVVYRDFGIHTSSAAWIDAIDRSGSSQNASQAYDSTTGDYVRAAYDPSELGGQEVELSEAFFHGSVDLAGDQSVSFRVGRHVLIWGESLYFSDNAIAAGQAPVDTYQMRGVDLYQSKDIYLPIGQASFSWQAGSGLAIEGYYQFEWRRSRINPEDAYASASDVVGAEGNRQIGLPIPGFGSYYYGRASDQGPGASGQYGLAVKWRASDLDLGLYALRYNAKTPTVEFLPDSTAAYGEYQEPGARYRLDYPRGIEIYGASLAGSLGGATIGAEISARRHMPLVNRGILDSSMTGGGGDLVPTADTLHGQLSWLYMTSPLPGVPAGASWTGEIAVNDVVGSIANPVWLESGRTRTAAAIRSVFEPQFFQVLPRVDLSVPLSLDYNFFGLSEVVPTMNRGTADVGLGVAVTVDQVWKAALGFTHYLGRSKNSELVFPRPGQNEGLSDWDYLSLSVQRTF